MTRTLPCALVALAFAVPAAAQSIVIDDDGWSRVAPPPALAMSVDIDDDGWSRVEMPAAGIVGNTYGTAGSCTPLERSAGLALGECGSLSLSELTALMADD